MFAKEGWKILRTENKYLGAARNKAAQYAKGDYLVFLDDDNLVPPHQVCPRTVQMHKVLIITQIQTYMDVALHTGADIFTAAHDVFEGKGTAQEGRTIARWVPLGPSPAVGLFKNCFGDGIRTLRF